MDYIMLLDVFYCLEGGLTGSWAWLSDLPSCVQELDKPGLT